MVGDRAPFEGTIEIYYAHAYGTVCDDLFNDAAARVVCRQLGYTSGEFIPTESVRFDAPIWLDNVVCNGDEARLDECKRPPWGSNNCDHHEDTAVRCEPIEL